MYDTKCESNLPNFDVMLLSHNQEEADTLIVLHGIDVAKRNPFDELVVSSPDTDVLLLFIYFYKDLCNQTRFLTGRAKNIQEIDVMKL